MTFFDKYLNTNDLAELPLVALEDHCVMTPMSLGQGFELSYDSPTGSFDLPQDNAWYDIEK